MLAHSLDQSSFLTYRYLNCNKDFEAEENNLCGKCNSYSCNLCLFTCAVCDNTYCMDCSWKCSCCKGNYCEDCFDFVKEQCNLCLVKIGGNRH